MKRIVSFGLISLALLMGCREPVSSRDHSGDLGVVSKPSPTQVDLPSPRTNQPFLNIQAIALAAIPGQVVKVELENEHGKDIYEIKILAHSGRVIELEIDAVTGTILKQEAE
jgi:uncharacterized membrane protein YkoI